MYAVAIEELPRVEPRVAEVETRVVKLPSQPKYHVNLRGIERLRRMKARAEQAANQQ